jgi:tetratricopeptide (TPR) repeat protein
MRPKCTFFFFICYLLLLNQPLQAQSIEALILQGDLLEKQMREEEAYQRFKEVVKLQPRNLYALIRCSELASRIGKRQPKEERQYDYYNAARIYAERAIKENPFDSEANMVMAVAFGRMALMKNGKDKVSSVRDIKTFAERSLQYNPKNFKAMHVLGKWHYEVSNLTAIERGAARILFGGLPKASFDSSIYFYEKARVLSPGFILNYLELAKAYEKNNKRTKAIELLKYIRRLPNTIYDDAIIKSEAAQLLEKWKRN